MRSHVERTGLAFCAALICAYLTPVVGADSMASTIEADWLRQSEAWQPRPSPTQGDAAGAVDGIKDGKYAFHTAQEANPWWQVDLGTAQSLARLVVYNRLDYAPGLHNADTVRVLVSEDAQTWRLIHDQAGQHFGGVSGAPPLEVRFPADTVRGRYLRLQLRSDSPIFFHLDEVEVYGSVDPEMNLALGRPADQSSVSIWSRSKLPSSQPSTGVPLEAIRHFAAVGRRLATQRRIEGVNASVEEAELAAAARALEDLTTLRNGPGASTPGAEATRVLYFKLRWVVRRLVFLQPCLSFDRLLMVKRFCQETYPDVCLNHMPWVSRPGGDLCVLRWSGPEQTPRVEPILRGALGPGHVHGADLHWEGQRIVFGYAKTKTDQPPEGWLDRTQSYRLRRTEEPIHLFEVNVDGTGLRQLTHGEWSDLDPTYAPNDHIVFVSERCRTSLQCNEYDKDETSCNLYMMRPDGGGIRRLSVNKDGDYLPHTLDDGTIGYTRWEYHERSWAFIQSLWTVRPDGTQADAIFKQHFVNPWALEDVRSIPGTRNQSLVCVAAGHHTLAAGPVVVVTPSAGINQPSGIRIVTPGVVPPEGGMDGVPVAEGGVRDAGGYYMHPWPLSETTFLAAYTYGTGKTGVASEIDPAGYAIYLIDVFGAKELIYRDPAISCFLPQPLRARNRPPVLPDTTDPLATSDAVCLLTSASYGCDGVAPGQVRYLRIAEPVGWPYDNALGGQRYGEDHRYGGAGAERKNLTSWTPIRILGDVPLEPDGSVKFRVPADTAVYFQLLDENRQELRRMRSFVSFQPGEQRACVGCHESREIAPARDATGLPLAMRHEPATPLPAPWGDRPVSFLRDVQPVLDRQCARCHTGLKPAGGVDLAGGLVAWDAEVAGYGHNRAYETLLEKGLVSLSAVRAQDASITPPLAYGSLKSRLMACLTDDAHRTEVKLTDDDRLRLVMWIDANAPYHDRFVNKRAERAVYSLPSDQALGQAIERIHAKRCAECHPSAAITRLDWIDLREPNRSRFLTAPLAKAFGGQAKCSRMTYASADDPDYRAVRDLVESAVRKAWALPRRDLESFGATEDRGRVTWVK